MRIPSFLFLLATLAAGLLAPTSAVAGEAHEGHDPTAVCSWQADARPVFPPGETGVVDVGLTRRHSILGELVGTEDWSVVVLPGYHVGFVHAWDKGIPLSSKVIKSYARQAVYGVYRVSDCCRPTRRARATMSCGFGVRAAVSNPPGSASAQGVTYILAANTQVSLTAAASATTDSSDGGALIEVTVPGPADTSVTVQFTADFDSEDESIDEVSRVSSGPSLPAPDEEYYIATDLDLEASADGQPWNQGDADASLTGHRVSLSTHISCGHCTQMKSDFILVNGRTYGVK